MDNDLATVSDEQLAVLVKNCKRGMINLLNMPMEEAMRPRKDSKPADMMHVKVFFLQALEDEIRRRGLDPSSEFWGMDLMAEVVAAQVDILTNG